MTTTIHEAVGAGRWFSDNGALLLKEVTSYIENAKIDKIEGRIVAALSPHAGFRFSGATAGHTFRAIRDQKPENLPEFLVIVGFPHHASLRGVALMDGSAIKTPIGQHPIDVESSVFLSQQPDFRFDYRYHDGEHSAENEIPFAQVALPKIPIVVALIGDSGLFIIFFYFVRFICLICQWYL
jgi:AmmeMemoRadiSam system protein B